jgi:hypothetical protein
MTAAAAKTVVADDQAFPSVSPGYYHVVIQMFWYRSATVAYGGTAAVVPAMAYGFGTDPATCTIN